MSSPLKQNTTTIQNLLNTINSLPEAGTDLPELTNEGSASDLLSGKQLIDSDGNVVDGTFTIDTELDTQDNLISQIQTALQNKAAATGEDVTSETNAYTNKLATLETAITALETELQGKASGGSGGGGSVETCTVQVNITRGGSAYQSLFGYTCTTFVDGNYTPGYFQYKPITPSSATALDNVTLNDVVCGSIITLSLGRDWAWWVFSMDNAENLQFGSVGHTMYPQLLIQAPTEPGAVATINCDYTD